MTDYCPTCGADVRVVGEGVTKRYEPTLAARVEELEGTVAFAAHALKIAGCQCGGPGLDLSEPDDHAAHCPLYSYGRARQALQEDDDGA